MAKMSSLLTSWWNWRSRVSKERGLITIDIIFLAAFKFWGIQWRKWWIPLSIDNRIFMHSCQIQIFLPCLFATTRNPSLDKAVQNLVPHPYLQPLSWGKSRIEADGSGTELEHDVIQVNLLITSFIDSRPILPRRTWTFRRSLFMKQFLRRIFNDKKAFLLHNIVMTVSY